MGNKGLTLVRVEDVAEQAFAQQPFADVSVSAIAARARCSTATIYEAYGSKAELYQELCIKRTTAGKPPLPRTMDGRSPLQSLLIYARERILYLSRAAGGLNGAHPKGVDLGQMHKATFSAMHRNNPIQGLRALIEQGQRADLIRPGDATAIAYTICAGISFEPFLHRIYFGQDNPFDPDPIIDMVFKCFVTDNGLKEVGAMLRPLHDVGDCPFPLLRSMEADDMPSATRPS